MEEKKTNRPILITGGHMTPALAVQSKLREAGFHKFVWVGHKYNQVGATKASPEYNTITQMEDTKFIDLPAGKLVRSWRQGPSELLLAIKNLLKIPYGFFLASWVVLRHRPSIVASFGGYLAVPVVFWAKLLGIKSITHEQTIITGVANSVLGKLADVVFISWPTSAQYYPKSKTILSGNPIRPQVFEVKSDRIKFANDLPTIYITCGNQGAVVVNKAVIAALPELLKIANVVHQTGSAADTMELLKNLELAPELSKNYIQQDFFYENQVGEAFNKADLVIARSGANTVTELLALGKPAIFIPIPWVTKNEQFKNAEFAKNLGIARILPQADLTKQTLFEQINQVLENLTSNQAPNGESLEKVKSEAQSSVPLGAADTIVKKMLDLM